MFCRSFRWPLVACCALFASLLASTTPAAAAVLAGYNFTSSAAPAFLAPGATGSTFVRGPGGNAQASTGTFATTGFNTASLATAISGNDYVGFTVGPAAGYSVSVESIQYDYTHASGGTPQGQILASHTGFHTGAPLGAVTAATGRVQTLTDFNGLTTPTEFRFYLWGSNSSARHHTFDNVIVRGQTQALASLSATVTDAAPTRAFRGTEGISFGVALTNDALAAGTLATQSLHYTLGVSGDGLVAGNHATAPLAGGASVIERIAIDTSTAGLKSGSVTLASSNASRAGGLAGAQSVVLDLAEVSILDRSNASFAVSDTDELVIDFGTVVKGSATVTRDFSLENLVSVADFTAGLDLDSIIATGDTGAFAVDLQTFANLAAGLSQTYDVLFDPTAIGQYEATYTLMFSDEDGIAGEEQTQTLTLTLQANVVGLSTLQANASAAAAPEPSTLVLLAGAVPLFAGQRRRRRA